MIFLVLYFGSLHLNCRCRMEREGKGKNEGRGFVDDGEEISSGVLVLI
jgi:hypothetical protein